MDEFLDAAGTGDLARVQALLPGVGEEERRIEALFQAVGGGHLDVAKFLLAAGVPTEHAPSTPRINPLDVAVKKDAPQAVALLLEAGANLNAVNYVGHTPLYYARSRTVACLLLDAGADVNAGKMATPLHGATHLGREDVLRELLAHPGVDVDANPGSFGTSPLFVAIVSMRPGCVAKLLDAGADPYALDYDGRTPLSLSRTIFSAFPEKILTYGRIATLLVAAGAREWDHVPAPCSGLEAALVSVWKKAPKENVGRELAQLFRRLEPPVKARLQATLRALHHRARPFGGLPEPINMAVLELALK